MDALRIGAFNFGVDIFLIYLVTAIGMFLATQLFHGSALRNDWHEDKSIAFLYSFTILLFSIVIISVVTDMMGIHQTSWTLFALLFMPALVSYPAIRFAFYQRRCKLRIKEARFHARAKCSRQ